MKKLICTAAIALMALAPHVLAQPAAPANPLTAAMRAQWTAAKTNIRKSADVMPEAKYGFKPVDTVRTYGAILAHVAGAAYEFCAAVKGEKPPHLEAEFEKSAKTKADIVKALDGSIAYCDGAFQSMDDKNAVQVAPAAFGGAPAARASNLMSNTDHFMEHYGNLVTYMRINGLVPPSSAPR